MTRDRKTPGQRKGLAANVGLLVLLGLLIYRKPVSRLLEGLSMLNIFGILLATTGGLGRGVQPARLRPQILAQPEPNR